MLVQNLQNYCTSMKKPEECLSQPPKSIHGHAKQEDEDEEEEKHDKKAYILQLPDHIIVEIFCKIPTKTLIRCQYVCKDWLHSFSNLQFTKDLFSRTHTCLLVQRETPGPGWQTIYTHFLVDLNYSSSGKHLALKLCRDPLFRTRDSHIVSSYNGFLLCEDRWMGSVRPYISNPITGETLAIPKPPEYKKIRFSNSYSGFGFSPISDAYKVVLIKKQLNKGPKQPARVLTVGSTTWRIIEGFEFFALSYGTYHDGFIHWLGWRMDSLIEIFAFDVETERFQQFPLPPCQFDMDNMPNYKLGVLKNCISVTVHSAHGITVWVMKEYGVKESWTQELEICKNSGYFRSFYSKSVNFAEEEKVLILGRQVNFPNSEGFAWFHIDGISWVCGALVHIPSFVSLKDVIRG